MDATQRDTLLAAARVDHAIQPVRMDVFADVVDEATLWALAHAHQLEFRLASRLSGPPQRRLLAHLDADRPQRQARLDRLLDADTRLRAAGIAAVWCKGPALAQRLFADPLFRRSRDLDVLVADVARASAVITDPDVDIAAHLPGMPTRPFHAVQTRAESLGSHVVTTLADPDAALCACLQAAKLPFKLGRIADAADLLSRCSADLLPEAIQAGVGDAVGLGMALAAELGAPIFSAGRFTHEARRRFAEFHGPNASPQPPPGR